jgi:lantibiotic modifying enzyme
MRAELIHLSPIVSRCLAHRLDRRYSTAREVASALLSSQVKSRTRQPRGPALQREHWLEQAYSAGNLLCSTAIEDEGDAGGLVWRSTYYRGKGIVARDINAGIAGSILALAEIVLEFNDDRQEHVLRRSAIALDAMEPFEGAPLPGLYIGECGVTAALLRAGQVLREQNLIASAVKRARAVAALPYDSPDLFHGTAGRLLTHLFVWDETKDPRDLFAATAAGDELLREVQIGPQGQLQWLIPEGFEGLSGTCQLGYAHGMAGIGGALLELGLATGDVQYLTAVERILAFLASVAAGQNLGGRGNVSWPRIEGGTLHPPFWCHGATGIGRFFLDALKAGLWNNELVFAAARSAGLSARWANPCQCHGLAGNIEFLLDVQSNSARSEIDNHICTLARLLDSFAVKLENGGGWITDSPSVITPDYMVGFAGIAVTALRLANSRRPHQLTRRGFRYGSGAMATSV